MSRPATHNPARVKLLGELVAGASSLPEIGRRLGVSRQRAQQILREYGLWARWRAARYVVQAAAVPPHITRWEASPAADAMYRVASRLAAAGYRVEIRSRHPDGHWHRTPELWCDGRRVRLCRPQKPTHTSPGPGGDYYHVEVTNRRAIYVISTPNGHVRAYWPPYRCAGWIFLAATPRRIQREHLVTPRLEWWESGQGERKRRAAA